MAGTINPFSLPGGRSQFFKRTPFARYQTGANPRTDGTMDVTDAINAGNSVGQWANSSGTMGGGYGFGRHNYGGGGYGFSGPPHEPTGRPSAKTADEYYANRDAAVGNPITNLKLNGPNRDAYMEKIMAEVNGGLPPGATQGTDAYYKAIGQPPAASVDNYTGDFGNSADTLPPLTSGFNNAFGTKSVGPNATAVQSPTGETLYGPQGEFGSVKFGKPKAAVAPPPDNLDKAFALAKPIEKPNPFAGAYASGHAGTKPFSLPPATVGPTEKSQRKMHDEELKKVDEEMAQGKFTPGAYQDSSDIYGPVAGAKALWPFFRKAISKFPAPWAPR